MAILSFVDDAGASQEVLIDAADPIVKVGRHKECLIRTNNNTVSRRHCQIVFTGTEYHLNDLGSSNGTFVKDDAGQNQRIDSEVILIDGQEFFCGNFRVTFRAQATTMEPVPQPVPVAKDEFDFTEPELIAPDAVVEVVEAVEIVEVVEAVEIVEVVEAVEIVEVVEAVEIVEAVEVVEAVEIVEVVEAVKVVEVKAEAEPVESPVPASQPSPDQSAAEAAAQTALARVAELEGQLDDQGAELKALQGASESLEKSLGVQARLESDLATVSDGFGALCKALDVVAEEGVAPSPGLALEALFARADLAEERAVALETEISDLKAGDAAESERVDALEITIAELEAATEAQNATLTQAQEATAQSDSEVSDLATRCATLEADLVASRDGEGEGGDRIKVLEKELEGAKESATAASGDADAALESLQRAHDSEQERAASSESKCAELETALRDLNDVLAVAPQPGDLADLEKRLKGAESDRHDAIEQASRLEADLKSIGDVGDELGKARAQRDEAIGELTGFKRETDELKDLLADSVPNDEAEALRTEIRELEGDLTKARADADSVTESADDDASKRKEELGRTEQRVVDLSKSLKETEADNSDLVSQYGELKRDHDRLQGEASHGQKELEEARDELTTERDLLAELRGKLEKMEASAKASDVGSTHMGAELDSLRKQLEEATKAASDTEGGLKSATNALGTWEKKVQELEAAAKKAVKRSAKDLDEANDRADEATHNLTQTQALLTAATTEADDTTGALASRVTELESALSTSRSEAKEATLTHESSTDELQAALTEATDDLKSTNKRLKGLESAKAELEDSSQGAASAASEELRRSVKEAEASAELLADTQAELAEAHVVNEKTQGLLDAASAGANEATSTLTARVAELETDLKTSEASLEEKAKALSVAEKGAEAAAGEGQAASVKRAQEAETGAKLLTDTQAELAEVQALATKTQALLDAASAGNSEADTLQKEVATLKGDLDEAKEDMEDLVASSKASVKKVNKLLKEIEALQAAQGGEASQTKDALAAAETSAAELEGKVSTLSKSLAEAEKSLKKAQGAAGNDAELAASVAELEAKNAELTQKLGDAEGAGGDDAELLEEIKGLKREMAHIRDDRDELENQVEALEKKPASTGSAATDDGFRAGVEDAYHEISDRIRPLLQNLEIVGDHFSDYQGGDREGAAEALTETLELCLDSAGSMKGATKNLGRLLED